MYHFARLKMKSFTLQMKSFNLYVLSVCVFYQINMFNYLHFLPVWTGAHYHKLSTLYTKTRLFLPWSGDATHTRVHHPFSNQVTHCSKNRCSNKSTIVHILSVPECTILKLCITCLLYTSVLFCNVCSEIRVENILIFHTYKKVRK